MKRKTLVSFFKYILLIRLLQLSHFPLFIPLHPSHPLLPTFPPFSSCLWVVHISSLASPFPILFLTSPCLFVPTMYASYSLYLFLPFSLFSFPTDNPLCDLNFCDSVPVLVVCLVCFCFLGSVVDSCKFVVTLLFIVFDLLLFSDKYL